MKPDKSLLSFCGLVLVIGATVISKLDLPRRIIRGADDALSTLDNRPNRPTRGLAHLCTGSSDTGPDGLRDICNPTERKRPYGVIGLQPPVTLTLTAPESPSEKLIKDIREFRGLRDTQNNPEKSPEK